VPNSTMEAAWNLSLFRTFGSSSLLNNHE